MCFNNLKPSNSRFTRPPPQPAASDLLCIAGRTRESACKQENNFLDMGGCSSTAVVAVASAPQADVTAPAALAVVPAHSQLPRLYATDLAAAQLSELRPTATILPVSYAAASGVTFEELLKSALLVPRGGVVRRAKLKFSPAILIAMHERDVDLALEVYRMAEALPSSATIDELKDRGFALNSQLQLLEGSALVVCFKDERVYLLKHLGPREHARACDFLQACGTDVIPGVTPFELFDSGCLQLRGIPAEAAPPLRPIKHFMLMPKYATALEPLPHLSTLGVLRMWAQLERALDCIHAKGFAHMDVKPSNSA